MIASVRGVVDAVTAQDTVINVGGVGLRMMATPTTLSTLTLGRESTLVTSLIVREDSMTLYGFADDDEREVFDILITLSGIGPRLGLAVLSVLTPDAIRRAVSSKDEATLTRVPGIGKKSAQRMILELGTRLGPSRGSIDSSPPATGSAEVIDALMGLGWNERDAAAAVEAVTAQHGSLPMADMLRRALQTLGAR